MNTAAKKIIRNGYMSYEIIASHDSREGLNFIRFSNRSSVRVFLSGFLKDYFNVLTLRQIVRERATGSYLQRTNDQAVVDQVAGMVMLGKLRIALQPVDMPTWSGTQAVAPEAAVPSFEPTPAPEPEEPQEAPVSPAMAAQADTLKRAAISGTPFCET